MKKIAERSLNDKEHDYYFKNNTKYHYIAVTKLSVSLAKLLSNHDEDRFCLNNICNFQTDAKLNKHQLFYKNHNQLETAMLKKFKMATKWKRFQEIY